jgi:hypothetical protein
MMTLPVVVLILVMAATFFVRFSVRLIEVPQPTAGRGFNDGPRFKRMLVSPP